MVERSDLLAYQWLRYLFELCFRTFCTYKFPKPSSIDMITYFFKLIIYLFGKDISSDLVERPIT